jgi:hypothetical protein
LDLFRAIASSTAFNCFNSSSLLDVAFFGTGFVIAGTLFVNDGSNVRGSSAGLFFPATNGGATRSEIVVFYTINHGIF